MMPDHAKGKEHIRVALKRAHRVHRIRGAKVRSGRWPKDSILSVLIPERVALRISTHGTVRRSASSTRRTNLPELVCRFADDTESAVGWRLIVWSGCSDEPRSDPAAGRMLVPGRRLPRTDDVRCLGLRGQSSFSRGGTGPICSPEIVDPGLFPFLQFIHKATLQDPGFTTIRA